MARKKKVSRKAKASRKAPRSPTSPPRGRPPASSASRKAKASPTAPGSPTSPRRGRPPGSSASRKAKASSLSLKGKTSPLPLQGAMDQLDTALGQWDSLTSRPTPDQGIHEKHLLKETQNLLRRLGEQLKDFESHTPQDSDPKKGDP